MAASRNSAYLVAAQTGIAAAGTVTGTEYVCGNGVTGQGYGGSVTVRIYNGSVAPTVACVGTVWGRESGSGIWRVLGQIVGSTVAGAGTHVAGAGNAIAPPSTTISGYPIGSNGLLVAGLTEQIVPFGPEIVRVNAIFAGNTGQVVSVEALLNELETI
jgi:hypothetical protein